MSFDVITDIGQTVLEGLQQASDMVISNLKTPIPYISGAIGILAGIIIAGLSGKNTQEPMD